MFVDGAALGNNEAIWADDVVLCERHLGDAPVAELSCLPHLLSASGQCQTPAFNMQCASRKLRMPSVSFGLLSMSAAL
jgi:hypothetical protein